MSDDMSELKPTTVNIPIGLVHQVDELVKSSTAYRNRSHFFQIAVWDKVQKEYSDNGEKLDFV